jgi:hypothetical protein
VIPTASATSVSIIKLDVRPDVVPRTIPFKVDFGEIKGLFGGFIRFYSGIALILFSGQIKVIDLFPGLSSTASHSPDPTYLHQRACQSCRSCAQMRPKRQANIVEALKRRARVLFKTYMHPAG